MAQETKQLLVRDGDMIEVDVDQRQLYLDVCDEELARRRTQWTPPSPAMKSGYQQMYVQHVMQASEGADLDFLVGCRGNQVPRESH
jgi:dihydroxyacid dehydratase/phosphogluconate dehydratase